jgi:3-hydroxyisobutyrate dehydrogenase-like beta-hydroxyacid dehydrogenase
MAAVAVVGCGLMGSAIARRFAESGHSVVVWNRTPDKAEALAGPGLIAVSSVVEAVRRAPLVVACTANYDTTLSALAPVDDWAGTTLVNHAVGTPGEATTVEAWAAECGADYLDGMPVCFPKDIGNTATMVLYSGSASAWNQHAATLICLGGASWHVSEDVAVTNVLEAGLGAFFMTAQRAYIEAVNYLQDARVPPRAMRMLTSNLLDLLRTTTTETVDAVELDNRQTAQADQATIGMFAEAARTNLEEMRAAGHGAPLLTAAVEDVEALVDAGLGHLGIHARPLPAGSSRI